MLNIQKKYILISNYLPDNQESMKLFMQMFYDSYQSKNLLVEVWHPVVFFGKIVTTTISGVGKWLSYIDKYILFPMVLIGKRIKGKFKKESFIYHICDHSNAPYLFFLPRNKTIITCHDVLAIRGAFGFKDAYCEASLTGKILQEWIFYSLLKAQKIGFVSEFTKNQFLELKQLKNKHNFENKPLYKVIYNSFNSNFGTIEADEIRDIFNKYNIHFSTPYILHVGSDLPRKNRELLVEMLHVLEHSWHGVVCFAGQKIDVKLDDLIRKYDLQNRVISIERPDHELLVALYNGCDAFVFPSFAEGFGWPLIEAQACGAPVITSALNPMIEVCGGAALHADPNNSQTFVDAFKLLVNKTFLSDLKYKGFKNCERFKKEAILKAYLDFYNQ